VSSEKELVAMANWTSNHVMVYGSEDEIRHFKACVTGDDSPFDFNRILPMPAELEGTTAPSPQANQRLLDLYGADNWYEWRIHNWGTQWEAGTKPIGIPLLTAAEQIQVTQSSECHIEYSFFTAWRPPTGIYQALIARFADRDVEIVWHFDQDPCEGRCGFLTADWGARIWDYDPCDFSDGLAVGDARHERYIPWTDADEPANLPDTATEE
jgi:hypothetical protein